MNKSILQLCGAATLALLLLAAPASAREAAAEVDAGPFTKRFGVSIAVDSAGPLLFKDTPDARLEETRVFQYGARLSFRLGDPRFDKHRGGLALGVSSVARSSTRRLIALDPYFVYAAGQSLQVQIGLGARIGLGTEGFRQNYTGILGLVELRYAFINKGGTSPVTVTPGIYAQFVLNPKTPAYSSAFVGARVELTIHKLHKGAR